MGQRERERERGGHIERERAVLAICDGVRVRRAMTEAAAAAASSMRVFVVQFFRFISSARGTSAHNKVPAMNCILRPRDREERNNGV